PAGDDGCVHGVSWFTSRLGGALAELSGSRRDMTLAEVLGVSITRTADAHRETCDLSHVRTPQATVVLARWGADEVEHLVLSDSTLLLESPDGDVRAVLDDRLDRLPREALRSAASADALRNAEGGFFTAAADPAVAARAVTGRTPTAEVRSLLALTDGAARWVEVFGEGGWADCLALVRKSGPQELIDRVRAAESADPDGVTFRRGKTSDDATVTYVEL
uniref:protein phosphatase 2C domain-containing protein n=1 Tax=Streptomyces lushanensis TaxID=1434255 RepID=UPI0008374B77